MLIDWFTVAAQIVNFLILVALLKHFLYGRILRAMDERQRKIADRFREAEKKENDAEKEAARYRRRREDLEKRKEELLARARVEAEAERKERLKEAGQEIDRLREQWRSALRAEQEGFLRDLRRQVNEQVGRITRRFLRDLADAELEGRIVDSFLLHLKSLDLQKRKEVAAALARDEGRVTVESAFDIASTDRQKITRALHQEIGGDLEVEYRTATGQALGLAVKAPGYRLAWDLEGYLTDLEQAIAAGWKDQTRSPQKSGAAREADE